eukprot:CAMPEP_0179001988 /NCGR_PEP_ID=MMETSP0795-20121207/11716_1 /TAXON_ID=88552 /ORGANISM="Amoebophrya sp., Strain Ameob2" /LENGTH=62 /DNA_ID=CAMNT_0020695523 /DNA_START=21 /DNA_END=206 /DNA_ORIENTATION=+
MANTYQVIYAYTTSREMREANLTLPLLYVNATGTATKASPVRAYCPENFKVVSGWCENLNID